LSAAIALHARLHPGEPENPLDRPNALKYLSIFPITIGGMLTLVGVGPLCPTMSGMAPVLFSSLGLLGGFISSLCHLAVSISMALAAYLPEPSHAPLGRVYLAIGTISAALLGYFGSGRRQILRSAPVSRIYAIRPGLLRRRFPAVLSAAKHPSFREQLFVRKLRTKG
jgi:hypothetical protein